MCGRAHLAELGGAILAVFVLVRASHDTRNSGSHVTRNSGSHVTRNRGARDMWHVTGGHLIGVQLQRQLLVGGFDLRGSEMRLS